MAGFSIRFQPASDSTVFAVVCKILMALTGWNGGTGIIDLITAISGGGNPVQTLASQTMTGAAILMIPSGSSGYISAAQGNTGGSLFVGGSNVTNSGAFRGIELSPLGISPRLTGPVYVIGTAGDVAGAITV